MLAKKYRLSRRQINLIYKRGRGRNFGLLGMKFVENRCLFPRFAVAIPLAVMKKAVQIRSFRPLHGLHPQPYFFLLHHCFIVSMIP